MAMTSDSRFDYSGQFGHTVRSSDSSSVEVWTMNNVMNTNWFPVLQFGVGMSKRLENFNSISVQVVAQVATGPYLIEGYQTLYPGTASESVASFTQRCNFIGLRMSYSMAYGPPKIPRHIRKQME
jgi:hypothetical protein